MKVKDIIAVLEKEDKEIDVISYAFGKTIVPRMRVIWYHKRANLFISDFSDIEKIYPELAAGFAPTLLIS